MFKNKCETTPYPTAFCQKELHPVPDLDKERP